MTKTRSNNCLTAGLILILASACQTPPPPTLPRAHQQTFTKGGDYRVGEGDIVEVLNSLPKEGPVVSTVNIDGNISLPLVGLIPARGLTLTELAHAISKRYEPWMKSPSFVVNLREMRSYRVFIFGEAKANGEYQFQQRTTLLAVLARAGGLTHFANERFTLFRKAEEGTARFNFTLNDILREEGSGTPLYAERGDVLVVE